MRRRIIFPVVAVVVVIGIVVGWYVTSLHPTGRLGSENARNNVLLMGLNGSGEAESFMVLSFGDKGDPALLSLPIDLRVKQESGSLDKLSSAYSSGGSQRARRTVAAFLGIEIPFYIAIDYGGLKEIVDQMEGVTVAVDEEIVYAADEEEGEPDLRIPPGNVALDGEMAVAYAAYAVEGEGNARIERCQKLARAILSKGLSTETEAGASDVARAAYPQLRTNLSLTDMCDLGTRLSRIGVGGLRLAIAPGTPAVIDGANYLEPQIVETERIVAQLIKQLDLLIPSQISVAVFNGNGQRLMGSKTADYLRARGFVVSHVANAETFDYQETFVVILGDEAKAWILYSALPIEPAVVTPIDFEPHYGELEPLIPAGTDLILVAGAGFEA